MNHTPGPLCLWPTHWAGGWGRASLLPNRIRLQLANDDHHIVAYVEHHGTGEGQDRYPTDFDYADAHRMVACWNACQGIPNENLQDIAHKLLSWDDLLEACETFLTTWKRAGPLGSHQFEKFDYAVHLATVAAAKAKPDTKQAVSKTGE